MATQVSLTDGAVASAGALAIQTNGTTQAVSISTGQVATLAQNPILTSGTANGVAYLNGSKAVTSGSALTFDGTNFATTGTASATKMIPTGGSATGNGMYLPASNTLAWSNNGSETMRLDSAGNLGLGVTPSAWSLGKAIEVGFTGKGIWANNQNEVIYPNNAYYNGGWKYSVSSYAPSQYAQRDGLHAWYNAPSGTAGNAITFTQAMTLDASGRLGVGTSSPSAKLTVVGGNSNTIIADNDGSQYTQLLLQRNSTANTGGDLLIDGTNATMSLRMLAVGALRFCTSTSAGDGTERARIDSSGNLGVGTTSTTAVRLIVKGSTTNGTTNAFKLIDSADADILAMSTAGDFYLPKMGSSTGTTVVLTSGNYLVKSSSSIRYKKDVEPIDIGLNFVLGLNPVKYKMKLDDANQVGFIAEDFPDERLVSFSLVNPQDKQSELQRESVNYANLAAPLVKAIQEQQAIIQSLTARITALESA